MQSRIIWMYPFSLFDNMHTFCMYKYRGIQLYSNNWILQHLRARFSVDWLVFHAIDTEKLIPNWTKNSIFSIYIHLIYTSDVIPMQLLLSIVASMNYFMKHFLFDSREEMHPEFSPFMEESRTMSCNFYWIQHLITFIIRIVILYGKAILQWCLTNTSASQFPFQQKLSTF